MTLSTVLNNSHVQEDNAGIQKTYVVHLLCWCSIPGYPCWYGSGCLDDSTFQWCGTHPLSQTSLYVRGHIYSCGVFSCPPADTPSPSMGTCVVLKLHALATCSRSAPPHPFFSVTVAPVTHHTFVPARCREDVDVICIERSYVDGGLEGECGLMNGLFFGMKTTEG